MLRNELGTGDLVLRFVSPWVVMETTCGRRSPCETSGNDQESITFQDFPMDKLRKRSVPESKGYILPGGKACDPPSGKMMQFSLRKKDTVSP